MLSLMRFAMIINCDASARWSIRLSAHWVTSLPLNASVSITVHGSARGIVVLTLEWL